MFSVLDLFKIGIGPSSAHTVGPMKAARQFAVDLESRDLLAATIRIRVELYGSLARAGEGHGPGRAILLGLEGHSPDTIDPAVVDAVLEQIRATHRLRVLGGHEVPFDSGIDLLFQRDQVLPLHRNGMRFSAFDTSRRLLHREEFYSIGGGFIVSASQPSAASHARIVPHPFSSAAELLARAREKGLRIHQLVLHNEQAWRPQAETRAALLKIWRVMERCVERGLQAKGFLPGALKIERRAPGLYRQLTESGSSRPLGIFDFVSAFAIAANEENAAGGRIVTAPTNGAAGILPALLTYYHRFEPSASEEGIARFLLVAGALGLLYKMNASISGAEMGCQGEVGVACSMAAGALVAALNGSNEQIENAAEIGMKHHLGLTCDPVGGLVQIPCIERNAIGAVKALQAAGLALAGDGMHKVSLDQVIVTMRQTGRDMQSIYKETSRGGLAVNVPEC